jgi:hypothetical protein
VRPARHIGRTGQAAARATARMHARLCWPVVGARLELPVPPLAARLLERHDRRRPAPVVCSKHTALRLAPVTVLVSGDHAAPAAAVVAVLPLTPPPAAAAARTADVVEMRLVRETMRERVEHTIERLYARGRRDEPSQRATAPSAGRAPTRGVSVPLPALVFPKLVLPAVATAPRIAAPAAPAAMPAAGSERAPAVPAGSSTFPLPAQAPAMPRLVDAVVGELERRIQAERERKGWLA